MGDDPPQAGRRTALPPQASSVREARRLVRRTALRHHPPEVAETAELLVSEIVTNALVHAAPPIAMAVHLIDDSLRVEVSDGSPYTPVRRHYATTSGTGRGLMLLDEMADEWGVTPDRDGKLIWFRLGAAAAADGASGAVVVSNTATDAEATVEVQLVDVPLLLYAAWRQQVESLLREHLLASLDPDLSPGASTDPLRAHAEASEVLALLAEHIPTPPMGEDPAEVLTSAEDPSLSRAQVTLPVPLGYLARFRALDELLEDAVTRAETGELLTAPTQPELRSLRRWLCEQVQRQSRGADPSPPPVDERPAPNVTRAFRWDPEPVSSSVEALIAADDTDTVVAVSASALDLLGYDGPQQLVGRRLVQVIPARYRQAHLAGFTLHLLTGRGPLLGRPVTVPAERRDGSETLVELTISAEHLAHGRAVFVARLRPADS